MKVELTKTKAKLCCLVALAGGSALAEPPQSAAPLPFVSPIFGDNMVLQREKPNAFGEGRSRESRCGWRSARVRRRQPPGRTASGRRGFNLPPCGPYTVRIASGRQAVELRGVLVGDVCGFTRAVTDKNTIY
jgi:hypothetical protein